MTMKIGAGRRKSVSVSQSSLVTMRPLSEDNPLPLVIEPAASGVNLIEWAATNKAMLQDLTLTHGGLLFRNFDMSKPSDMEQFITAVAEAPLEYRERSSPRSKVSGNIYTSTDHPPEYPIFMHNENSYQDAWPLKIFFCCAIAAERGGETPIADCRRVTARLDPAIRERFERLGWMYVRNFGDGFGLPWQTVFQTEDTAAVEEYCRGKGIDFEWKEQGRLRIRATRPAITRHPKTGEALWFNHLTFFHISTLEEAVRNSLLAEFGEHDLPTNTFYGDGSSIEPEVLDELRRLYNEETVSFQWQVGDLLMLDNMICGHARAPFEGKRQILTGMAEPIRRSDVS